MDPIDHIHEHLPRVVFQISPLARGYWEMLRETGFMESLVKTKSYIERWAFSCRKRRTLIIVRNPYDDIAVPYNGIALLRSESTVTSRRIKATVLRLTGKVFDIVDYKWMAAPDQSGFCFVNVMAFNGQNEELSLIVDTIHCLYAISLCMQISKLQPSTELGVVCLHAKAESVITDSLGVSLRTVCSLLGIDIASCPYPSSMQPFTSSFIHLIKTHYEKNE